MWRFCVIVAIVLLGGCSDFVRDDTVRQLERNSNQIVVLEVYDASVGCGEFKKTRRRVKFYHNSKLPVKGDVWVASPAVGCSNSVQLELRVEE